MSERKNNEIVFKCKKVTNFALSLQNKLDITVQKFIFSMQLILTQLWRDNLPKYGRAIT